MTAIDLPGSYWFKIGEATFAYRTENMAIQRRNYYLTKQDATYGDVSVIIYEGDE